VENNKKLKNFIKTTIREFLNENNDIRGKCKCLVSIKFTNGMNYFKDYTYNYRDDSLHYNVAYEDGRFTTMTKETFEKYFQII
jgi:hypothetical protein